MEKIAMPDIILEGITQLNHDKLKVDIRAAIGTVYTGASGPHKSKKSDTWRVVLHFTPDATPEQQTQARQIALKHDPSVLTVRQESAAAAKAKAAALKGIPIDELNGNQMKDLMLCLVHHFGMVDEDGNVNLP